MRSARLLLAAALICGASTRLAAVEGSTAAGPIGGTDIRSAQLPPPGLYGGVVGVGARLLDFVDGRGQKVPALSAFSQTGLLSGSFLVYVPDVQVLGGSIGFLGVLPYGQKCGRLFAGSATLCRTGLGDPYVEVAWSRFFGSLRPSKYPGAFPIAEGLTVALGFGVVLPLGQYDATEAATHGISIGNNIYDLAPTIAVTYTTPPILAEGTEFSAKLYWNNYLTNPATQYATGSLLNVDFAVTERIGRFQVGMNGFYVTQMADDRLSGIPVPPDGRRVEILNLGGILAYDIPELAAAVKIKASTTAIAANGPKSQGLVLGFIKKFH